jgi:hypothetical protein
MHQQFGILRFPLEYTFFFGFSVKIKKVEDKTCLFCLENESVHHLFSECAIAKRLWVHILKIFGRNLGDDFRLLDSCGLAILST